MVINNGIYLCIYNNLCSAFIFYYFVFTNSINFTYFSFSRISFYNIDIKFITGGLMQFLSITFGDILPFILLSIPIITFLLSCLFLVLTILFRKNKIFFKYNRYLKDHHIKNQHFFASFCKPLLSLYIISQRF